MGFFGRVLDFYDYGPLPAAAIQDIKRREKKKREAAQRRRERYEQAYREANATITGFERYVLGVTPEDILRNRRKRDRIARAQMRADFLEDYADEIASQTTYITKQATKGKWWNYTPQMQTAIRRKVEREVWAEVRDEFDMTDYQERAFDGF